MPVARSAGSKRIASTATISGTEAIRIAVSDEDTYCSPAAISGNGSVISITAYAAIHAQRPRSWRSTPACHASASSSAAAERDAHEREEHGRDAVVDRDLDEQVRHAPDQRHGRERGPAARAHARSAATSAT